MKKININNFEEKLYYEKLKNGIEIYMLPLSNKKDFYCNFGTKYGGDDIDFTIDGKQVHTPSGIAHFLEHKMFDKDHPTPFEYYNLSGTDVNAETGDRYTNFHFVGNNKFEDNLTYLLRWVTNFKTTKEKVEKERGIILEEANMYKDNPDRVLYEKSNVNLFKNLPRKNKLIGEDEEIENITIDDIEMCYKSFYRPDNMYIIIVGGFKYEKALEIIKKELKDFKNPKEKIKKNSYNEPKEVVNAYEEIDLPTIVTPKISYAIKLNKDSFKNIKIDKYSIIYYLFMLVTAGFGSTSDFREYLTKKRLFNYFGYGINDIEDYYIISFNAVTDKPKELIKELDDYLLNIKIKEEDFERIKKVWIASEVRMIDNVYSTLNNILDDIITYGEYKNNKIEDIRNLNFKTMCKVIDNLSLQNTSKIVMKSKKTK